MDRLKKNKTEKFQDDNKNQLVTSVWSLLVDKLLHTRFAAIKKTQLQWAHHPAGDTSSNHV